MKLYDKCVVAGSFDPVTKGHMHVIGLAAMTFEKVIVAIGINDQKRYFYTLAERLDMLKKSCQKYSGVTVTSYSGLTADFMREQGVKYLVRGIRNQADLQYENKVFAMILKDNPDIEAMYFNADKKLQNVSSTLVKQCIVQKKPYANYIPYEIIATIEEYNKTKNL